MDAIGVLVSDASPIAKDARSLSSNRRLAGRSGVPGTDAPFIGETGGGVDTRAGLRVLRRPGKGRSRVRELDESARSCDESWVPRRGGGG